MTDLSRSSSSLDAFAARLGVPDVDADLLALAVRHRSWCAENQVAESNERLEFLGDSVLGLVITGYLYTTYPDLPEGELAKVRASVVSSAALARVARDLDLGAALDLGRGEEHSGGRDKSSILADAIEGVFGAVYLSGGLSAARELILGLLGDAITEAVQRPGDQDFKTRLQELVARSVEQVPQYRVRSEGPEHAKEFYATVEVALDDGEVVTGLGQGRSKKQAEQAAARAAWHRLVVEFAQLNPSKTRDDETSTAVDPIEDRRSHA